MKKKRRWLWVLLFIWIAALLATLATSWNVVLFRDYHQMLMLARQVSQDVESATIKPWNSLIIGTLGFVAAMATILLFFLKILKEMKLNQLQSEFLAAVSHELKTPIAAAELSASLIRSGGLSDDEVTRLWHAHDAELKRLREDVEALLETARMEATSSPIERTSLELESWLSQSMQRWKHILGPEAKLVREGAPLPSHAKLNLKTLNLITDNLIDNARKFSRGAPELIIRTRSDTHRWQIEFQDNGWGFDPAHSRRIFTRFFRARTDAPYSIPGTGLGLYLAHAASRTLGLTLKGESEGVGRGACFTLEGKALRGGAL